MPPRGRLAREVQALYDQARKSDTKDAPRKHHLVPASYLRRWAEGGKVRVTVIDEGRSYLSAPESAARETDYYRVEHPQIDPTATPPLLAETILGRLEGNAKTVIDNLLATRDPNHLSPQALVEFALFLAMCITRGKTFRDETQEMLADLYRLQWANVTDAGIDARLRQHGVDPTPALIAEHREFLDDLAAGRAWVERPQAQIIAQALAAAEPLGEELITRNWAIYETPPILVTCDEPLVLVGGPGAPRSERSGVAVAGAASFPLSPYALLVLFHEDIAARGPARLDHLETAEINREIIAAGTRWAFERPSRHVTERLRVPAAPPKASLREGPIPQGEGAKGELFRTYRPTRWTEESPPWPVSRWWPPQWLAQEFPCLGALPPGAYVEVAGAARSAKGHRRHRRGKRV